MSTTHVFRLGKALAGVTAIGLLLTGCVGGPTYGTSKSAGEQLMDDLGSSVSLGGNKKAASVKYNPRPALVMPGKTARADLAAPQASLTDREANPQWAESPEDMRQRLREEAQANKDNPNYRSPLLAGKGTNGQMTETEKWEAFRKAKAEASGAPDLNRRRFLTDPPAQYRTTDDQNLTDLGEPEVKKEKQRKKEASVAKSGSDWWNPFQ